MPDKNAKLGSMEPLYSTRPGGMRLFNAIIYGLLLLDIVLAVALLLLVDAASAAITFFSMLATFGVVWVILPRRYEVWPEHLRLVFPLFGWNIDYTSIDRAREAAPFEAYAFVGVRFATAPSQAVTILRRNGNLFTRPNLVISPENREEFLRQLQRAMRR